MKATFVLTLLLLPALLAPLSLGRDAANDTDARAALALALPQSTLALPQTTLAAACHAHDESAPADKDGWRWCTVRQRYWRYAVVRAPSAASDVEAPPALGVPLLLRQTTAPFPVQRQRFFAPRFSRGGNCGPSG